MPPPRCPQERAPWRLYDHGGSLSLSWIKNAPRDLAVDGVATADEVKAFVHEWPRSVEGQRLLAELRCWRANAELQACKQMCWR